jgi:hypothetical protein
LRERIEERKERERERERERELARARENSENEWKSMSFHQFAGSLDYEF